MESALEIIHGVNHGALLIAILYPHYITPEQAFNLWERGTVLSRKTWGCAKERVRVMHEMRRCGVKWKDIAKAVGMSNESSAHSYYSHRKHLLTEQGVTQ